MAGRSDEYHLHESERFTHQIEDICENVRVERAKLDDILNGVRWALSKNPNVYPVISGTNRLRLAKTRRVHDVPMMNFWFAVDEDKHEVEVLSVETVDVFL